MEKTIRVPVENVERAIEGARELIFNLQNIQKSRLAIRDFAFNNPECLDEILKYDTNGALSTQDVEFLREYTRFQFLRRK